MKLQGNTSREPVTDLQYSLNSGQDPSLLQTSNLRPVLVILGARVARDITSVRVASETSLELPMNNLFGLTTTNCHLIICRTWSSALSHSLPLSLYGLQQHYSAIKPTEESNRRMGIIFPFSCRACIQLSNYHVKYHRHWNGFHRHQNIWALNRLTCILLTFML